MNALSRAICAVAFCALAGAAMWLGWPWVVGFALFFIFMLFA
jgi:hypothetical protein